MRFILYILLISIMAFANIGKIQVLSGKAEIIRDSNSLEVNSGDMVEKSDTVVTAMGSRLQIIFNDRTVVTLGSNSKFSIEDYLYDEQEHKANAKFNLSRGIFKAMTGRIGKIAPKKFSLKLKTATIGIRGTRFMGKIVDNKEIIACTEGLINVSTTAGEMNVRAGEITSITNGAKPETPKDITDKDLKEFSSKLDLNPALAKKISEVKLNSDLSFDKEEVGEIVNEIASIQDDDTRAAAIHKLEDTLNSQLDASAKNRVEYTKAPSGELKWGFYTTKEPSVSSTDNLETIVGFTPDDVWRDPSVNGDKPNEKIQTYITQNQRATYTGKSIGYITYNTLFAEILDNENNSVNMTFDFGERTVVGTIAFEAYKPGTTTKNNWKVYISSGGNIVLSQTGYEGLNFADTQDDSSLTLKYAKMFNNRFYGENASQASSYFRLISEDNQEAYGLFIANQSQAVKMEKLEVTDSNDNIFKWGYWAESGTDTTTDANKLFGAYIEPKDSISATTNIQDLIDNEQSAKYSADVLGTVYQAKNSETALIENGTANFDVDFGAKKVTGNISFDAGSDKWNVDITKATLDATTATFSATEFDNGNDATVLATQNQLNGTLYNEDATNIGGNFIFSGSNGDLAIGAYKGEKQ